jgi:RNA polymerase sigma-70 factor (ECF subfamily)
MLPDAREFPLSRAFLEGGPLDPARFPESPQLEELLHSLWQKGERAWPGVRLDPESFVRHLGARLGPSGDGARLASTHTADLYLACACARAIPEALASFDRHVLPLVSEMLRREGGDATWADEVQQVLRQKLFVGGARSEPKIAEYSGVGSLGKWLRAVAVRTASVMRRGEERLVPFEEHEFAEMELLTADPELEFLKTRYRIELKKAFAQALQTLSDRELTVLRFHLVDGLNIDKIGVLYGTHRATVARWIAGARTRLLEETRRLLGEWLGLTVEELDNLIRLIRSNLDLSIVRQLKQRPPTG